MNRRLRFDGFDELIREPLANSDPLSFKHIVQLLQQAHTPHAAPFSLILRHLVGKRFTPAQAREHWAQTIALKQAFEAKLNRTIGIQTAAVEHFTTLERGTSAAAPHSPPPSRATKLLGARHINPYAPDYHLARLKDEVQRSHRYNHALSAIIIDTGPLPLETKNGQAAEPEIGLAAVVRIVERTIRSVDILAPCGANRLLVILPDTNKREAQELAERIRCNVHDRTARMPVFAQAVCAAIAADQCNTDQDAKGLLQSLEGALDRVPASPPPDQTEPRSEPRQ